MQDSYREAAYFSFAENAWKSFDGNLKFLNLVFGEVFVCAEFVDTSVEPMI